eukprot:GHVQ01017470.1.p1 GENE.GHVQ01017470.1~~GHVQ01017470.1.p1  ORF type:complete len:193 (+),score=21.22 GHVQ01017470.1:122-700(+)
MSKGLPCAKALQLWEEKHGTPAAEAEVVKLCGQSPPIERMDNSLNALVNASQLSLSTNSIDKIIPLPALKNIQILSLGRNLIKKLTGLDEMGQSLRELWISYNQIEKLDGIQSCTKLQTLYMSNNKIKQIEEIEKLASLPEMTSVLFKGNPFYEGSSVDDVRCQILKRVPQLKSIDNEMVTEDMREKAASEG